MKTFIRCSVIIFIFISIIPLSMAQDTGDLQVTSKPGIRIYIDNTFAGITKDAEDGLYIEDIEVGQHEIRAEKEGFVTKRFAVTIESGKAVEIKIGDLVPKPTIRQEDRPDKAEMGKIIVTSVPNECEIAFLDEIIKKDKYQVIIEDIVVGTYPITFSREGNFLRKEINIKANTTLNIRVNFRQKEIIIEEEQAEPVVSKSIELPREKTGKDGAIMVLIPAGEFIMGSDTDGTDERPAHKIYLDAFYIDKYEVTNAQYKKFMDATKYKEPKNWRNENFNAPNQPIVGISWNDAKAYAEWAGKRLPTEAEWEKSARGGLVGKKYPWGDTLDRSDANYAGIGGLDKWEWTAPVGSFAPNSYGLHDMAGNVWEWCEDWYASAYYFFSPKSNPKGPQTGSLRIYRGGSWSNGKDELRVSYRSNSGPDGAYGDVGFRCVESK